jgi:hypothetical protein
MDCFFGKMTGTTHNPYESQENRWFPVGFPLSQSIELCDNGDRTGYMGCVKVKQHRFQHVGSFSGVLRGFHSIETIKNGGLMGFNDV